MIYTQLFINKKTGEIKNKLEIMELSSFEKLPDNLSRQFAEMTAGLTAGHITAILDNFNEKQKAKNTTPENTTPELKNNQPIISYLYPNGTPDTI